jgi:hypothetical protein
MTVIVICGLSIFLVLVSVAAIWILRLLYLALIYRGRLKIAVHPALEPTRDEHRQPALREFLGRAAPIFAAEGFSPAQSVHAPRFATFERWTQILFIDRSSGTRASILCMQEDRIYRVTLAFATEFSDGQRIVTASGNVQAVTIDIAQQCRLHRKKIVEAGAGRIGIAPECGDETAWLSAKAALVAKGIATRNGFHPDPAREWYVPDYGAALRIAWRKSRVHRSINRIGRRFRKVTRAESGRNL